MSDKHSREQSAETRVELYASWIADDVDGLIHNVAPPFGQRLQISTVVLAEAHERLTAALATINTALAADRGAHAQE